MTRLWDDKRPVGAASDGSEELLDWGGIGLSVPVLAAFDACPRALALLQLGRQAEAEQALTEAVQWLPLVGKELVKKRHRRPPDLNPDHVTYGGAGQAYCYWRDQGQHRQDTPGAVELVRECLRKAESQ